MANLLPSIAIKLLSQLPKPFLAVEGDAAKNSSRIHDVVGKITKQITENLTRRLDDGGTVHIEDIQDQVEFAVMREGEYKVARAYVLYREQQSQKRAEEEEKHPSIVSDAPALHVTPLMAQKYRST